MSDATAARAPNPIRERNRSASAPCATPSAIDVGASSATTRPRSRQSSASGTSPQLITTGTAPTSIRNAA